MLTDESYQVAWLVYGAGALGLLLSLWPVLLRYVGGPARLSIVLLVAVLMLLPAHPDETVDTYAPAVVVAGFDLLTHGPEVAAMSARPLLILGIAALVPGFGWALLRRLRRGKNS